MDDSWKIPDVFYSKIDDVGSQQNNVAEETVIEDVDFSPKILFSELDELASVLPSGKLKIRRFAPKFFSRSKIFCWEGRRTAGGGAPAAAAAAKIEKRVGWRWLEKSPEKLDEI